MGNLEIECKGCALGQKMCNTPCWGLPYEFLNIINSGRGAQLMIRFFISEKFKIVEVLCGANPGYEGRFSDTGFDAKMHLESGCVYQNQTDFLCQIHEMKPIEGKLACCKRNSKVSSRQLHMEIARSWDSNEGREIINNWKQKFLRDDPDILHFKKEDMRRDFIASLIHNLDNV